MLVIGAPSAYAAGTLRFALDFDPAILDTAQNGSYTDRIVFTAMCDSLLDLDPHLNYVPELATAWEWSEDRLSLTVHLRDNVTFQDGEPLTAEAVRANFERYRLAPESVRKTELKPVVGEDVIDRLTLKMRLSAPYAPLLSLLANRPGTPLSPRILGKTGDQIAANPVCAGPFKFDARIATQSITMNRYPGYWDAKNVFVDRIEFQTIANSTIRLVNLKAGALDIVNRLAPTDVDDAAADQRLKVISSPSLGYQLISFNLGLGSAAGTPMGTNSSVREAFEKSIDRAVLNQVVFDGKFVPSNQMEPPGTKYWNPDRPVPPRDLDGARTLLKQAGLSRVKLSLIVPNDPISTQVAQVMQSMAAEAGFDIAIDAREAAAIGPSTQARDFQAAMGIWSGRPDPDGNASIWLNCKGFVNRTGYCNPKMDELLAQGASTVDPDLRVPIYHQIADLALDDRPYMVLYHWTLLWGASAKVTGFVPRPDGLWRPTGLRVQ